MFSLSINKILIFLISMTTSIFIFSSFSAEAQLPLAIEVHHSDYKMDPKIYLDVINDRPIELWARAYYPTLQKNNESIAYDKIPVVVILHGNHSTCGSRDFPRLDNSCEYTTRHQCSGDYQVIQNHLGFEYLANELAKKGHLVLSINANYGINCGEGLDNDFGLTLARGRLILKHLQLLSDWNRGLKTDGELAGILKNKIDFNRVGLLGHSRGGEGVRAALNLYNDPQEQWFSKIGLMNIKAIFEMAPVDGESNRILNPVNVAWNVLIGACDLDVPHLDGIKVFDRMAMPNSESLPRPKSAILFWGGNHNFFNTEWQTSDSRSCGNHLPLFPLYPGSLAQRKISIETVVPFFTNYLGEKEGDKLVQFFDPLFPMKKELKGLTTFERSFVSQSSSFDRLSLPLEDFYLKPELLDTVELSQVEQKSVVIPGHEALTLGSQLTWKEASLNTYAQFNWSSDDESAINFPDRGVFEMRIALAEQQTPQLFDMSIQFVGIGNEISVPLKISHYISMFGPAAGHSLLQTLRISVKDVKGITQMKAIRFVFDGTSNGKIYVNSLYLRNSELPEKVELSSVVNFSEIKKPIKVEKKINSIEINLDRLNIYKKREKANDLYEGKFLGWSFRNFSHLKNKLAFYSAKKFEPKGALIVLEIGGKIFKVSGFEESGDLHYINFFISDDEKKSLSIGSPLKIFYLSSSQHQVWNMGRLIDFL